MATEAVTTATTAAIPFSPPMPYNETYWIISEIFLVILTLIIFCLLFVVTCYTLKIARKKSNRTTKNLLVLCLISATAALGRVVSDQVVAFKGWQSDSECLISVSVSIGMYGLSIYPAYIFLWYRQNVFYSDKTLRHLMSKRIGFISKATLVILALGGAVVTVLFLIPDVTGWKYQATATGCRDANDQQDFEVVSFMVIVITVITQVSLLGLLLYPLITTKRRQERTSVVYRPSPAASQPSTPSPSRKASQNRPDLLKLAVMKAHKQAGHEVSPFHRPSTDSTHAIYTVNGFSSDNESVRSASDAGFTSDATSYVSNSEFDTEDELRPSTSSPRRKRYISTKDRHATSRPGTPSRSRRGSGGSVSSIIRRMRKRSSSLKLERKRRSKSEIRKERKLKSLIRKVFLLCCVCVVTDVLVTVIQLSFVTPELAYLVLYDVNLVFNILCIVLSFKEWKQILTAPFVARFCPDPSTRRKQAIKRRGNGATASPVVSVDSQPTANTRLRASLSHSSSGTTPPVPRSVSVETGPFETDKMDFQGTFERVPTPDIIVTPSTL